VYVFLFALFVRFRGYSFLHADTPIELVIALCRPYSLGLFL
jgi:hypothetical protein